MMELITLLALSGIAVFWFYHLAQLQRTMRAPIVSFGRAPLNISLAEREAVLIECLRQQRWAFALVWFAVVVGIVLSVFLLSRAFSEIQLSRRDILSTIGLVGDISVAGGALRLYRLSTQDVRQVLDV